MRAKKSAAKEVKVPDSWAISLFPKDTGFEWDPTRLGGVGGFVWVGYKDEGEAPIE